MRSKPLHSPLGPLTDIKLNIELVREFIAGKTFAEFQADTRTVYAVTRCPEIISEASRRLPGHIKERNAQIPWTDIAAAGSVYRHAYELVRDQPLWRTTQESLGPLLEVVEQELARLGEG